VLAWLPKNKNITYFSWKGPYTIVSKLNPVTYGTVPEGKPDATSRVETIRNLTRTIITQPLTAMPKKSTSEWHCRDLKKGTFIIFRQITSSRIWKKRIFVGEVVSDYDEDEDLLAIHYHTDLGTNDHWRNFDPTKPLVDRKLKAEYKNKDGVSVTRRTKINSNSVPVIEDLMNHEIDILVGNFQLKNFRIPAEVAKQATEALKRDRPHAEPRKASHAPQKKKN